MTCRSIALQYHPDRNRGDPGCEERLSDDLIEILHVFARGGFGMRGVWGCKGNNRPRTLAAMLQIKQTDLERELATLCHMEKVRGELQQGKRRIRLW